VRTRTRLAAAALALVAPFAVTACSGGDAEEQIEQEVEQEDGEDDD
jgi:hypothetical protein